MINFNHYRITLPPTSPVYCWQYKLYPARGVSVHYTLGSCPCPPRHNGHTPLSQYSDTPEHQTGAQINFKMSRYWGSIWTAGADIRKMKRWKRQRLLCLEHFTICHAPLGLWFKSDVHHFKIPAKLNLSNQSSIMSNFWPLKIYWKFLELNFWWGFHS